MLKSFRGISTRHFMSPRDRSALSRDYCANCVDLMVLSYTRILNGTKHLLTGKYTPLRNVFEEVANMLYTES